MSDVFFIYYAHLPKSKGRRVHPSSQSGKNRQVVLRPRGPRHPQVTKLNITLSLDTERLIEARDRGSRGGVKGQMGAGEPTGKVSEGKLSTVKLVTVNTICIICQPCL